MIKQLLKTLKLILKFTPVAIAIVLFIRYATDPVFYLDCTSHGDLFVIALIPIPTIFCYSRPFIKSILLVIFFPLIVKIIDIKPKEIDDLNNGDYYLSTGCFSYKHVRMPSVSYGTNTYYVYSSMQIGYESMQRETYENEYENIKGADTVILRLAYNLPRYMVVYNANPTHEDIQKYMEPVLFHNGEEQPRPNYSELDFSNDERRLYMYLSHPQIVKVVSKQKDEFLRNLVTLQINDTTQITVNLMYKDVMSYVDENDLDKVFNSIDVNGRGVVAKVSNINPRVIEVTKWNPTGTDYSIAFDKKTQVDTALEKELMTKSVKQLGYIINKHKEESWTSRHKKKVKYFATVCVNDTIDRTFEIMGKDNYAIYNSIEQGDAVLVRVSEIFQYAVRILNWQPTLEEVEKYNRSANLQMPDKIHFPVKDADN